MKKKKRKKEEKKKKLPWLNYFKVFILGVLFIGALGKVIIFYPPFSFFLLGFFISLFLLNLSASLLFSLGVSLFTLFFLIPTARFSSLEFFFYFPLISLGGAFLGEALKKRFFPKKTSYFSSSLNFL